MALEVIFWKSKLELVSMKNTFAAYKIDQYIKIPPCKLHNSFIDQWSHVVSLSHNIITVRAISWLGWTLVTYFPLEQNNVNPADENFNNILLNIFLYGWI